MTTKVHEKRTDPYRLFPPLSSKERNELKLSIQESGLRDPIVLDEFQNVIDGHERRDICESLGIDCYQYAIVRFGLTENEKKALSIELNLFKRTQALTQQKRRQLIEIYLIANPAVSEPRLSEMFGVSQPTVNRLKKLLIELGKMPKVSATIGKDGISRRVGNRHHRQKIMMVQSRREYDRLMPDLIQVVDDFNGLVRRPKKFVAKAQRKKSLGKFQKVRTNLPQNIELHNCDFRNLQIEPNSVDLVLTDPLWTKSAFEDWAEAARLASIWLKPDGRFVSLMGTRSLADFLTAMNCHLIYETTLALPLQDSFRGCDRCFVDSWRPIVVFSKTKKPRKIFMRTLLNDISEDKDKRHHNYQQPIDLSVHLLEKMSAKGDLIVDPFVGTGTNAVAASLLGRSFVGSEIKSATYKVALARVTTEGKKKLG